MQELRMLSKLVLFVPYDFQYLRIHHYTVGVFNEWVHALCVSVEIKLKMDWLGLLGLLGTYRQVRMSKPYEWLCRGQSWTYLNPPYGP